MIRPHSLKIVLIQLAFSAMLVVLFGFMIYGCALNAMKPTPKIGNGTPFEPGESQ